MTEGASDSVLPKVIEKLRQSQLTGLNHLTILNRPAVAPVNCTALFGQSVVYSYLFLLQ